jgi:hypothetical protein
VSFWTLTRLVFCKFDHFANFLTRK